MSFRRGVTVILSGAGMLLLTGTLRAQTPSTQQQCIKAAQQEKKACKGQCADTFQSEFIACFGPNGGCAQTCLTAKQTCLSVPQAKIHACASDPTNPNSCRSKLRAAVAACKSDPDPNACSDAAELAALECRQGCVDQQQPTLDECRDAFRTCLQGCTPGTTTTTTSTTSTTM